MMKPLFRRRSLKALAALGLGLGTSAVLSTGAHAADPVKLSIGWPSPMVGPHGAGAKAFAEELERLAPGRFKVGFFPNGSLGGEREMVEAVQLGTQELAIHGTAILGNFVPEMLVLDIPFLFRDTAHARAVVDGPIGQELAAKMKARGLIGLTFGEIGFRHVTSSRRAINGPDDMKGLKIRTMENPIHLAAFRALGALPTPMSWTEVLTGLQQGTIDGQENPISILVAAKMWEMQKHVTLTRHVFTPISFTMSAVFFNKLSPADQEIMRKAALAGRAANRKYVEEVDASGVAEMKKHGMEVVETVDPTAFQKKLEPVYKQYSDRFGPMMQRIVATK
jgi:tripartite ATP-independent transporter DctP family solute receptor